jgi:hypothetical protein
MSDAIEALSEYKYLLESMGHDAQSTGPYMRCLDAIASLQAMQGESDTKTYTNLCQKGSAPQPAVPEEVYTALVGVCTAACDGVVLVRYEDWNKIVDWVNGLLSAAKVSGPRHQWDDGGERCVKCGDKDWFAGAVCDESKPLSAAKGEAAPTKTKISEAIFGWGLRNDDGNHLSMDDTDEIAEYIMAQAQAEVDAERQSKKAISEANDRMVWGD